MPLRLRELVERELYRLGGAGTSSQVMNSGGLRELHAPGCATPQGLSMLEKADPSSVQSLESRIDALFASLLGEKPLPRTVAPVIVPTSPSALQPQTPTPAATPGVSAESADPSGYAEELARMKGSTPELQPAEPDPEFEAMADALDAETNAGLAELQRRRIYAQVNPEGV